MEFATPFLKRLIGFWKHYEHHIGVGALLVGFTFDLWVAKKPDSVFDNLLLTSYLFIAAATIIVLNLREVGVVRRRQAQGLTAAEPLLFLLILQFCFGGLASNLLVLYGKSGTLATSALFILLLAVLVFGNEYLRSRYAQLRFNVAIYYVLLLTYLTISVPTFIAHALGPKVFLESGLLSLVVVGVFLSIIYAAVLRGARRVRQLWEVSGVVLAIFIAFNVLYFLNIIPPVPLSLKNIGIYHTLSCDNAGICIGTFEPTPWYVFWRDTSATYTLQQNNTAYCFSAVYAPADLTTPILHRWEYYDPKSAQWQTVSRISFPISGGRAAGYRAFSIEGALTSGQWRCDVETTQGELIGRISFAVVQSSAPLELKSASL